MTTVRAFATLHLPIHVMPPRRLRAAALGKRGLWGL